MTRKRELAKERHWFPPKCKQHVTCLRDHCSNMRYDRRDKLEVLTDIEYRVVAKQGSGFVRGFSHDRLKNTLSLNVQTDDERISVSTEDIVRFERIGPVPSKYTSLE